jgi:hemolysin D
MKSAEALISSVPDRQSRSAEELAFLPAALEIVETPPPPLAGAVGGTIVALFCLALGWAAFGNVDIVTTATGRIVPSGRTKIIQPFETGVVRAIHVRDGQAVTTGEVLIELDPTMTVAELGHLKNDLMATQLETARLQAALAGNQDPSVDFRPPEGASFSAVEMHRRFLASQTAEHNARLQEIKRQEAQKEAERETIQATINKLGETLPLLQERVNVRKYLTDKELGSKLLYLTDLQELVGQQQDLLVQKSRYREIGEAVAALAETRIRTGAEYERTLLDELAKAEQKVAGLAQDVIKAEQRTKFQDLVTPVDGVVQQLAIHTIGGVVTPAQALAVVVPKDSRLEIEAMVPNRDIGFVHVDQDVEIKIDTFNFTRYGLIRGKVLSVSQDAIAKDKPPEKSTDDTPGATTTTSEPKGQELVYAARISLDMAITAEIKTGARSIISYLLSPLLRYRHESLRER